MSKTRAFVPARREIRAKVGKTCKKKLENVAPAVFITGVSSIRANQGVFLIYF